MQKKRFSGLYVKIIKIGYFCIRREIMDHVRIQTTQNVEIEYPLASVGDRILATLLDFAFFMAYGILIVIILSFSGSRMSNVVAILLYLPVLLYSLLCETFFQGKSFGKMIMKIQVVKLDGTQARFSDYLLRWLFRIVDLFLFSGLVALLTIIISGKGQRIGDLVASTTVIKFKQKTIDDTILKKIVPDYQLVFQEVSRLTDHDIAIIKEVLAFSVKNNNQEAILKLAAKTKQTMGILTDLPPQQFLETVIQDYNHFYFEK